MTTQAPAGTSVPGEAVAVTDALGLTWHVAHDPYGLGLEALAGLAIRDNPKRAHLVVSKVLAKHVPVRPAAARAAGLLLAGLVHERLGGGRHPQLTADLLTDASRSPDVDRLATGSLPGGPVVIGYCETATGLGHTVADAFGAATYLHTTRHPDPHSVSLLTFEEAHSHAVAHFLQPRDTEQLEQDAPVVLVDDELTTGSTALNTIEQLLRHRCYPRFVVATLLDLRTPEVRLEFDRRAAALGVPVDVVALLEGHLTLPDDVLDRARPLQARLRRNTPTPLYGGSVPPHVPLAWDERVPFTARHRFTPTDREAYTREIARLVQLLTVAGPNLPALLHGDGPVLVVGTEECMITAIRLGHALELHQGESARPREIRVQSTTRSPVLPQDIPSYAIRRAVAFDCPTDPGRSSFLYNVAPLEDPDVSFPPYEHVVVVTDASPDALGGLAHALQPYSANEVLLLADPPRGDR